MIDLHCHSTASDGMLAPADVVRHAAVVGIATLALTDHDTTAGVAEAMETGREVGVNVIGACEFSVQVRWGEMHLLGYFLPVGNRRLEDFLVHARDGRDRRARAMVSRLNGLGLRIAFDDIRRIADGGAVGRPHVARALLAGGHVTTIQQAFDRYIGTGRPAFVDKELPPLRDVADLVHAVGGIVSAAHLKRHGTRTELAELRDHGLDAVETRHPSHDGETRATITEAAEALDLGRTGGSDWHGDLDTIGTHARLGSQDVPDEWLPPLQHRRPAASAT
ncbi:MAG: PHP domain-containing protein [Gemmatimonadales bacterium]|nr:PHP domain-containing protein [Gemmatimonadales bacterium]